MTKAKLEHVAGLQIERKLGQIILVNNGELLIQVIEIENSRAVRFMLMGDREKYKIGRLEASGILLEDIIKQHHTKDELK